MSAADADRVARAGLLAIGHRHSSPIRSRSELVDFLHQVGKNPTRLQLDALWTNNTTELTAAECVRLLQQWPDETHNLAVKAAFRQLDKNGDGRLTIDELHEMLIASEDQSGEVTAEEVRRAFKRSDLDNSQHIDFQEFLSVVQETADDVVQFNLDALRNFEQEEEQQKRRGSRSVGSDATDARRRGSQASSTGTSSATQKSSSRRSSNNSNKSHQKQPRVHQMSAADPLQPTDNGLVIRPDCLVDAENTPVTTDARLVNIKGCVYAEADARGHPSLLCHQYELRLTRPVDHMTIAVKPTTNCDQPPASQSLHDLLLFVAEADSGKVVGCTTTAVCVESDGGSLARLSLGAGTYTLIPFITPCRLSLNRQAKSKAVLFEQKADGKYKLNKAFRMVLMNIFDMFDLNDDGCLSRDEFNVYNVRTGDEDVTDQEWAVLTGNFEMRSGGLTMRGFLELHEMEVNDADGDTDDLWMALHQVGYNGALQCTNAWPFLVSLWPDSPDAVLLHTTGLRPLFHDDDYETKHELLHYWQQNSETHNIGGSEVNVFHTPKLSVCIAPEQANICVRSQDNTLCSEDSINHNKILYAQAKSDKAAWSFRLYSESE